jgi:hypothetical protein
MYVNVPPTLQLRKSNAISFFGMVDKTTIIPFKDANIVAYNKYIRFPKYLGISASLIGNRIYVRGANATGLCWVNIRGIFQTPSQVYSCPSENDIPTCFDWDCQYPIGQHLLESFLDARGQPVAGLFERILSFDMKLGLSAAQFAKTDTEVNPI